MHRKRSAAQCVASIAGTNCRGECVGARWKRQDGENYVTGNYRICSLHHILSEFSNQGRLGWPGMGETKTACRILIGETLRRLLETPGG